MPSIANYSPVIDCPLLFVSFFNIIPPSRGITVEGSSPAVILQQIQKIQNILHAIFALLPNKAYPRPDHIYGLVLGIWRALEPSEIAKSLGDLESEINLDELHIPEPDENFGLLRVQLCQSNRFLSELAESMPIGYIVDMVASRMGVPRPPPTEEGFRKLIDDIPIQFKRREVLKRKYIQYTRDTMSLIGGTEEIVTRHASATC